MKVGDTVKFLIPFTQEEKEERFLVMEVVDTIVIVQFVCDLQVKPLHTYLREDLVKI